MTRPIRVLIADDEALARQRLRRLLRREPDVQVVGECADGAETVAGVLRERPDLLFLDVQMPELDGLAVLRTLPEDRVPVTVFVTAYDQYALRAFEAHALDYLLKPFTETRFAAAFERARAQLDRTDRREVAALRALLEQMREELHGRGAERHADRLLVKADGRVQVIPLSDVDYLEAARNQVKIHAGRGVHLLRETLTSLEQRLDPARFARIHRSVIVNLDRVAEIEPWFSGDAIVVLRQGAKLRLSRSYRQELESRLARGGPRRPR